MKLQSTKAKVINSDALGCMEEMATALYEAAQYLDDYQDADDGIPNRAMMVLCEVKDALRRYEASK